MGNEKTTRKKKRTLTPEARAAMSRGAAKACAERWGCRGDGVRIYVDREAAEALESVQEKDRRALASAGIMFAVWLNAHDPSGSFMLTRKAAGGKGAKNG